MLNPREMPKMSKMPKVPKIKDWSQYFRFQVSGFRCQASGDVRMKLYEFKKRTAEPGKSEPQNRRIMNRRISKEGIATLVLFLAKIDRIPSFDRRHSLFDIRFFKVSFSIRLAAFQAGGGAGT